MGLGWFETKPKLEDEGSGKGVLRVGVGCLKAAQFLVPAELVVACGVCLASSRRWVLVVVGFLVPPMDFWILRTFKHY